VDAWRIGTGTTQEEVKSAVEALQAKLSHFERDLVGPFLTGSDLSLVDTASIPMLQRVVWTTALRPELDVFAKLPKVRAWLQAGEQLEAVQRSTVADVREQYVEMLRKRGGWIAS